MDTKFKYPARPIRLWLFSLLAICLCLINLTGCTQHQEGKGVTLIAPIGDPPADTLIWSPVNSDQILITAADVGFGDAQVFILNTKTGQKLLLAETKHGAIMGDGWSADGKRAVLRAFPNTVGFEQGGLWSFRTDGSSWEFLKEGTDRIAWAPDGKTIAAFIEIQNTATKDFQIGLLLTNIELGTDMIINLPIKFGYPSGFSWSPDAQQLVFSSNKSEGQTHLFILDLRTSNIHQITTIGENLQPSWSPNGNWIAYRSQTQDGTNAFFYINLIKPDGTCNTELLKLKYVLSPTWSPDSKQLAYIGIDGIYMIDVDQYTRSISCP
jgi:Tol biopolymer transport system component